MEENTNNAAQGIGFVIAGAVVAMTALDVLSTVLVGRITCLGIEPVWASVEVAAGCTVLDPT